LIGGLKSICTKVPPVKSIDRFGPPCTTSDAIEASSTSPEIMNVRRRLPMKSNLVSTSICIGSTSIGPAAGACRPAGRSSSGARRRTRR